MTAFATVQDLAERTHTTFDPTDLQAIRHLEDATALIKGYTNQDFVEVNDDMIRLNGSGTAALLLPNIPVTEVSDVAIIADDATTTALEATDYRLLGDTGILVRLGGVASWNYGGICWPAGWANVAVTYTHGYETIPPAIVAATCDVAMRLRATVGSIGSSGLVIGEVVGKYEVTYSDTVGGGSVDSSGLTLSERSLLDPWRLPVMA